MSLIDTQRAAVPRRDTVLVVEGEVVVRSIVATYLRDCEYKVIEACSAEEALAVLRQPGIVVDVLFSDRDIPGSLNGYGLAQWVRANRPQVEIILTGTVQEAADAAGELCENGPTMNKPYTPQSVADKIRKLLNAKRS